MSDDRCSKIGVKDFNSLSSDMSMGVTVISENNNYVDADDTFLMMNVSGAHEIISFGDEKVGVYPKMDDKDYLPLDEMLGEITSEGRTFKKGEFEKKLKVLLNQK